MAPQERTKTGLKLYVPPPPPPRPLAVVVPSQLSSAKSQRSMIRSRDSSLYGDKEEQVKHRSRPIRRNRLPWDNNINYNHSYYHIRVEDQIRQKVGMVSSSRHKVMLQDTEALAEKQHMIRKKAQIQQHHQQHHHHSSRIHHRKSAIDAAKKRKSKNCSLNAAALSDEYSLTKTADIECFKDDSELPLKSVDGQQDGMEECAMTINDDNYFGVDGTVIGKPTTLLMKDVTNLSDELEKLRGRLDILESSSTLCQPPQNAEMTMTTHIPIDLEEDTNKSSSTPSRIYDEDEEEDAEINNETMTTAVTTIAKKKIFPRNAAARASPDERVDENFSNKKGIERITTTAAAVPHNDDDPKISSLKFSETLIFLMMPSLTNAFAAVRDGQKQINYYSCLVGHHCEIDICLDFSSIKANASLNGVLLSNTGLVNQLNEAEKKIREQQLEILELRKLLDCGKKLSSTPSMQTAAAALNASLQSQKSHIDTTTVTPDDHWGAALATVERLLNCTSPHDNNMTNDGKERIAIGGPAPWNTGGGATTEIASSAAAKEWQLVGMRSGDNKHDMKHPPMPQQAPRPLTTIDVVPQAPKPNDAKLAAAPVPMAVQDKLESTSQLGKLINSHHRALHQGGRLVENKIIPCPTSSTAGALLG